MAMKSGCPSPCLLRMDEGILLFKEDMIDAENSASGKAQFLEAGSFLLKRSRNGPPEPWTPIPKLQKGLFSVFWVFFFWVMSPLCFDL